MKEAKIQQIVTTLNKTYVKQAKKRFERTNIASRGGNRCGYNPTFPCIHYNIPYRNT
jgi:hypothetical protein